jgi:predicted dehydrogenase/threonine dehydrogenase-like Zn-dependent dehydrogenase
MFMRQVFLSQGAVQLRQVCQPLLDDYSVLVLVRYSFISSGTEVATLKQAQSSLLFSNIPHKIKKVLESVAQNGIQGTRELIRGRLQGEVQTLGYSCSGQVVAVGNRVKQFKVGDYVACAGAGFASHADIVCVPENLVVKVSDERFLRSASLTTIGAIALQGVRRTQPQLGETVCVIGLGLLGQITVQLLKRAGCTVVGIDLIPDRLRLAQRCGADKVLSATLDDVNTEIAFFTGHQGVDSTIITAASPSDTIVQQAMEVTRKKGRVVLVGDVGLNVQRAPFYAKEIDFLISCSYGPGRYDSSYEREGKDYPYAFVRWTENRNMQAFLSLIEQEKIDIHCLIAHEVSLHDVEKAYDLLRSGGGLGIVLNYGNVLEPESTYKEHEKVEQNITFAPALTDTIRVGLVGAGGFAKIKLMPIVTHIKKVKVSAVVDSDVATSMNAKNLYGAAKALINDMDLFQEDLVDALVIASPHKFHCDQILNGLQHGKAVFCEKPMVTSFEQLNKLSTFLDTHVTSRVCVDYNRSFAPFMQKIKQAVQGRSTPIIAHYRMNAGYIPEQHWVQSDIGAGRIIGEACHIFDLFYFLTDAKPVSVSVESLNPNSKDLFATDNFSAQISFSDGSVCTLLYTALGHAGLGKERLELFFDGKAIVMNDYKELHGFGLPHSFNEKTITQDKGHEALVQAFFESIKRDAFVPPISFERLRSVAHLTLTIDQLACQGGGKKEYSTQD